MLTDPSAKYIPYPEVPFPSGYIRQWPTKRNTTAPRWLSTDLRDGNQALVNPMSNATKTELFRHLVKLGFKEIEVAYPSASDQEFQFVRSLIDNGEVPDDVALQVITPAREDLIRKSIESLSGCRHAIVHLYNAVSPVFREVVFKNTKDQTIDLTLVAVRLVKRLTEEDSSQSGTKYTLNYCLETFSQTEPDFAVELANRVFDEWGRATPEDKIIFNLPSTVEIAPSNYYADQVEYFHRNIKNRDCVVLSIHPHNDRGTAVAAGELALLAGGERIEGCLLGNGERTGNVDIITMALNLYSQGVPPRLDFSRLPETVELVSRCNEMHVPIRYPYAGQLVFSAFAGTHQDAIKKGLDAQALRWAAVDRAGEGKKYWAIPYIPIDPKDLGYGYESLIRVSSQSGKAGTSYVIKQTMGIDMPRRMQVSFYKVVQEESERVGKEMTALLIGTQFKRSYFLSHEPTGRLFLHSYRLSPLSPTSREPSSPVSDYSDDWENFVPSADCHDTVSLLRFEGEIAIDGKKRSIIGNGKGPVNAVLNAFSADLGLDLRIAESSSQLLDPDTPGRSKVVNLVELYLSGSIPSKSGSGSVWGVGISSDTTTSKCRAVFSAANGLIGDRTIPPPRKIFTPRPLPGSQTSENLLQSVKLRAGRFVERESFDVLRPQTPTQG